MGALNRIERRIFVVRGHRVMLDADLARLYGVSTKRLNEQVKRNLDRFPPDFMFKLTQTEKDEVVANCDHLMGLKFSPSRPRAFTEHGALMLASVLNSSVAVRTSVLIVRAFIRLREALAVHKELARKLDELERKVSIHDGAIQAILGAIRQLMEPPAVATRRIGFKEPP